ncbi:MAG: ribonuclease III [Deltaproteobacteria bacterium]|nr:ribonuclease III [Deltaproteobacteria bacterium]MBW1922451.1 ribonuclease III [Deltaproteobacteria bacterium]MBW1948364.1 ribonuclease III [Deltaproteobacteria bacterium]MBW2006647.1 ribonuclease III [Deltaproteobacteria bacterium]MBW2101995.1 ribonuclease III [Deltaproteobacteria bacterium]
MNKEQAGVDAPEGLSRLLGYHFREPALLAQAFQHASYVNEHPHLGLKDNERLEFLGDAVLDLAVSHILMERFPEATEGDLSKFRSVMVDEAALSRVAVRLGLGDYLLLGKGEEQSGGREKPSILADVMEAVLGAVYLDAGFERALGVIRDLFSDAFSRLGTREMVHDYKSLLQEYTQAMHKVTPEYRLLEESGPPHDRTFRVALILRGEVLSEGQGKTKKEAEQQAAKEAFFCLKSP